VPPLCQAAVEQMRLYSDSPAGNTNSSRIDCVLCHPSHPHTRRRGRWAHDRRLSIPNGARGPRLGRDHRHRYNARPWARREVTYQRVPSPKARTTGVDALLPLEQINGSALFTRSGNRWVLQAIQGR
jgi:hypothetical protein